jgi:hypothetical protein
VSYHGDIQLGASIDLLFTTISQGVPTVLAGSPVVSAYVGNSLTQLTAGITLDVSWDGVVGLNHVTVAATSGNGYATGTDITLVITTGTVNSLSVVGYVIGSFSIENRAVNWNKVSAPTSTVGLTGTTISTSQVVASVTGAVGSVTGAVGSVTGNVGGNVTGSVGSVVGAVGSVTGNVGGNLVGNVNGNVVGSVASVTGNVGGNVTGSVGSVTGAVGSVTGNVGGNVTGSVGSVVAAVSVTSNVKKNQALSTFEFPMFDATDHVTPKTGLTVTATRSIDGAAFGACANAVSEIGATGTYKINLAAADLNGNSILFSFAATGADTTLCTVVTQP